MATLLRYEPWEGAGGAYFVNDCTDLKSNRGKWWVPARALGISPAAFVELLVTRFHPDNIKYLEEADVLIYSWKKLSDARAFKNWLNAEIRKRNFVL
jgi:hypothetical protein